MTDRDLDQASVAAIAARQIAQRTCVDSATQRWLTTERKPTRFFP